jgi:hypothetical protein
MTPIAGKKSVVGAQNIQEFSPGEGALLHIKGV